MSKEVDQHIIRFFELKKLLGSGAYGHVWKVVDRRTRKQYALKKIFDAFQNSTDAQRTYRQITILTQLQHPNIIELSRVIRAKNNRDLYLVFEFMEADLHSLVGQQVLQPVHLLFVTYQILRAVRYMHSAQLLHRDLKPSNILINSECEIKICDFGLARTLTCEENQEIILSEEVATRWYRSPEMLLGSKNYSKPTDVWSVGCIVAELLMGQPIFPGSSTLNQLERIIQFTGIPSKESVDSLQSDVAQNLMNQLSTRRRPLKEYFQSQEAQLIALVVKMLEFNPHKRITIDQALKSKCLQEFSQKEDDSNLCCAKFVVPCVDDNLKLSLQQYRKIIYQDIERRYPQENCSYANCRSGKSSCKPKKMSVDDQKTKKQASVEPNLKRQRSLISIKNKSSASLLKKIENCNPYQAVLLEKEEAKPPKPSEILGGQLKKSKSRKQLVKKKTEVSRSTKFKKA